jgi:hypothetical protein
MNNIDTSKFDAILVCDSNLLNESSVSYGDPRGYTDQKAGYSKWVIPETPYAWYDNPKLYAQNAFGRMMYSDLNNMGRGYTAKVTDFGKWVVVDVAYHNFITGRSASKTFLIVFNIDDSNGTTKSSGYVLSTANKWRSISGYGQAVSYIKSACSSLESGTSTKL